MALSEEARLILVSLADGPNHGYAIAQDIERFSGRRLGPGTLYGAVARLEATGHIEALAGDARRRPYRLTSAGARALKADLVALRRISLTAARRLGT
jgi:DNA-binding PadR family transcriptional regulator